MNYIYLTLKQKLKEIKNSHIEQMTEIVLILIKYY